MRALRFFIGFIAFTLNKKIVYVILCQTCNDKYTCEAVKCVGTVEGMQSMAKAGVDVS
jgi:hypothetical protein